MAWGPPKQSIEAECARRGRDAVVEGCAALIQGKQADAELLLALAGPGALRFLSEDRQDTYWLRVWGARGLLWAWDGSAVEALRLALCDEHWRVREMALKVVARYGVEEMLYAAIERREDDVPRVRTAAQRAIEAIAGNDAPRDGAS